MASKAERDEVRGWMLELGCSIERIAVEMAQRFGARPRLAWRYALGWTQVQLAHRYNRANPGASVSSERVCECENWPSSRSRPSAQYLMGLARAYGNGCSPTKLADLADLQRMPEQDRQLLMTGPLPPGPRRDRFPFGQPLDAPSPVNSPSVSTTARSQQARSYRRRWSAGASSGSGADSASGTQVAR
ncbi:transcriptional regulator with XRE-family HTH domain [Kutzneria viridogrisea]|uniref:Uncharacterized protein n=2 Tax=Kutzneria TaxID=43356 RepID=W5WL71_9PSEU|nr:hypothetical protein KALB_8235 [Kutzneria albida DSM 43870]MBA8931557.1 transcriptional regulator with XRE-family HTH domain [Kutzneria viridogrisea]